MNIEAAVPKRAGGRLILVLGGMIAMSAAAIDIGIPATPVIARELGIGAAESQFPVSAYIAGLALGQVPLGWLGDRHGRRRTALAALAAFSLLGLASAAAPTLEIMIAARLFQGFAGASGPVLSRAIARDLAADGDSTRLMSTLIAILGLAPLLAPLVGAALLELGAGWRSPYGAIALYGVALSIFAFAWLPETRLSSGGPPDPIGGAALRSRDFLQPAVAMSLNHAGYMVVVTSSSTVLAATYGATPIRTAALFACAAATFAAGSLLSGRLAHASADPRVTRAGFALTGSAMLAFAGMAACACWRLPLFWAAACIYTLGHGLTASRLTARALIGQGRRASSAAGVMGAIQLGLSFLASACASALAVRSPQDMALLVSACGIMALLVYSAGRRGLPGDWRLGKRSPNSNHQ